MIVVDPRLTELFAESVAVRVYVVVVRGDTFWLPEFAYEAAVPLRVTDFAGQLVPVTLHFRVLDVPALMLAGVA